MGARGGAAIAAVVLAVAGAGTTATVARAATCAPAAPGGEWPVGGHDLSNTRSQPDSTITPDRARTLTPLWKFATGHTGGLASGNLTDLNATPVIANGCVYVGSGDSTPGAPNVFALNADTGQVVWKVSLPTNPAGLAGAVNGSIAVDGNTAYAYVNQQGDGAARGPYLVALDARTGAQLWRSAAVVTDAGAYTNATPTLAGGVIVAGFSAPEGDPYGHGGMAFVDAADGTVLKTTYTVPPSEWGTPAQPLYAGGGVWTTPAIDAVNGYAYMGTGNPFSKKIQHPNTNAILKVDIRRARSTFGQIVGTYTGTIEQVSESIRQLSKPTCELLPDAPIRDLPAADPRLQELQGVLGNSVGCLQLDLDFGAAPNLFTDSSGRLRVGDLQKSGVYHVADATTMAPVRMHQLGLSCQVCNGASTAYDPGTRTLFGDVSPGSWLTAFPADGGSARWYSPVLDGYHYGGVSAAAGVLYTIDGLTATLLVNRAADGLPLLRRSLLADTGGVDVLSPAGYSSAGVAIARNTVYAEIGSHVVAYRPGTPSPVSTLLSKLLGG